MLIDVSSDKIIWFDFCDSYQGYGYQHLKKGFWAFYIWRFDFGWNFSKE